MSAHEKTRTLAVLDVEDCRVDVIAHFDDDEDDRHCWYSVLDSETGDLLVDHCGALPTYEQIAQALHHH